MAGESCPDGAVVANTDNFFSLVEWQLGHSGVESERTKASNSFPPSPLVNRHLFATSLPNYPSPLWRYVKPANNCPMNFLTVMSRSFDPSRCNASNNAAIWSSSQFKYVRGTFRTCAISLAVGTGGSCTPSSYRLMRARLLDSSIPIATPTFS